MAGQSAAKERFHHVEQITWDGLTWVNIEMPTFDDMEYLRQHYPFHPLDLDDCLSRIQRPKIDEYEDYLFIVLHFPLFSKQARVTRPSQVSTFIGKNYLVTLHTGQLKPLANLFNDCQLNEKARHEYMSRGSGYLLYRILDRLVDYCLPITNKIVEHMEEVEDRIFDESARGTVREISILRRDLISYRRIISALRPVVHSLEQKTERFTTGEMEVYYGDLVDHLDKIWDTLDECKEVVEGLSSTNDALYSYRTSEVMRVLTILATIMLPLTVVASIYGMNVPLPGGLDHGNPMTFASIIAVMLAISGGMLFFFRLRRWI
jgi:magnesium transporter